MKAAKKTAKAPSYSLKPQDVWASGIADDAWYFEDKRGLEIITSCGLGVVRIPWSALEASLKRHHAIKRARAK